MSPSRNTSHSFNEKQGAPFKISANSRCWIFSFFSRWIHPKETKNRHHYTILCLLVNDRNRGEPSAQRDLIRKWSISRSLLSNLPTLLCFGLFPQVSCRMCAICLKTYHPASCFPICTTKLEDYATRRLQLARCLLSLTFKESSSVPARKYWALILMTVAGLPSRAVRYQTSLKSSFHHPPFVFRF